MDRDCAGRANTSGQYRIYHASEISIVAREMFFESFKHIVSYPKGNYLWEDSGVDNHYVVGRLEAGIGGENDIQGVQY